MSLPSPASPPPHSPSLAGNGRARASTAQEQIGSIEQRHPGQPVANFPVALQLEGPLDTGQLAAALNAVVTRHDILRTRFEFDRGRMVQVVAPALNVPVPVIDLRLLPEGLREAHAFRLAQEEAARPFEAHRLPLLRTQLYLLEDTKSILVLTFHRGIFDHESLAILLRELTACYAADRSPVSLPALSGQYAEYAASEADPTPPARAAAAWWQDRLAGDPTPLRLPADRPRHAGGAGRSERHDLSPAQRDAVESLARREGTNPFTIFLTVFQILLHRYAGAADYVFGLVVSSRPEAAAEMLPGPFTQAVPFRANLAGDPVFRRLLTRVRSDILDVFAHPYVLPGAIDAEPAPERAADPALACPVWFFHDAKFSDPVTWAGLRVQELELDAGACPCELAFHVVENDGSLSVRAEYDPTLFSAAIIQRLLCHYGVLLDAALARPHSRISALPMLTALEQRRLFCDWNNIHVDYPRDATVAELVTARAATLPDAVAAGPALTYRELERRSNQLGRHLRAAGVRPGSCIGLCLTRPADLLLGVLGVMKAGGMVLPLDPGVAVPQQARLLADARPDLVLTTTLLRSHLPAVVRMLLLDTEAGDIHRADDAGLATFAGPDDSAWVVATGGTAGPSRLVELSHRAVSSMLHAAQQVIRLAPGEVLLATARLSSPAALIDLLLPLAFGARVELAAATAPAHPPQLAAHAAAANPTVMLAAPVLWRGLLDAGWTGSQSLRLFSRDEPLTPELADRLLPCGAELWNLYGTAETAGACMAASVTAGRTASLAGRPLANVQIHLLDSQLQPVPIGLPGEVFVGGDSLATRYRRQPANPSVAFVPDPFRRLPGARLFRTGDRARRLLSGEIELLGRRDAPAGRRPVPSPLARPIAAPPPPFAPVRPIRPTDAAPPIPAGPEIPFPRPLEAFSPAALRAAN